MPFDVLIIGAGATGLLAARELSAAGLTVMLLEANAKAGGRMHTLSTGFSGPAEAGAEFIHGDLEWSLRLAGEARIPLHATRSIMARVRQGNWSGDPTETDGWELLLQKMAALSRDEPIAAFLAREFPGEENARLRDSVRGFAEGYDLADMNRASTKDLYKEWAQEGDEEEYRLDGGYGRLTDYLVEQCKLNDCKIRLSTPVTHIRWQRGRAEVNAASGEVFVGRRLMTTVPLGVLQSTDALQFHPAIPGHLEAARQLGYGTVIKILLEFKTPFWSGKKKTGHTLFLLSDEPVPTWWTQSDDASTLLTGWLTGDRMRRFQQLSDSHRLENCLSAVASIFSVDGGFLRQQLTASLIQDWSTAPYIAGGYSFETINGSEARALLSQPILQTLYFAGEALYEGTAPATVEAALCSGHATAQRILSDQGQ